MASNQPWRYRCPEEHCSWAPRQDGYVCERCKENGDEYRFDELVDMKRNSL